MRKGFRKEHINYNGLSWRIDIKFWVNHGCEQCERLNEENPVENRLFYTHSGKEFRAHRKLHKEQK
jgi:hypothetical protein